MNARRAVLVALSLASLALPALAKVPPSIRGVVIDKKLFRMSWDAADGAAGYNVYQGDVQELGSSYGTCVAGSLVDTSVAVAKSPPAGHAFFYLVSGFSEDGEGSLDTASDGTERVPAVRCTPARRVFDMTPNGPASDGVADGRVRPHANVVVVFGRTGAEAGVSAGGGETFVEALDLVTAGKVSDFGMSRIYRSQVAYDGPLGKGWDFAANARLRKVAQGLVFFDGTGGRWNFASSAAGFTSPPGFYGRLVRNGDGTYSMRARFKAGAELAKTVNRTASGLSHLHKANIVHRDLAARLLNVADDGEDEDCDDGNDHGEAEGLSPWHWVTGGGDDFGGITIDEGGQSRPRKPKGGHGARIVGDPLGGLFAGLTIDEAGTERPRRKPSAARKVHGIHRGHGLANPGRYKTSPTKPDTDGDGIALTGDAGLGGAGLFRKFNQRAEDAYEPWSIDDDDEGSVENPLYEEQNAVAGNPIYVPRAGETNSPLYGGRTRKHLAGVKYEDISRVAAIAGVHRDDAKAFSAKGGMLGMKAKAWMVNNYSARKRRGRQDGTFTSADFDVRFGRVVYPQQKPWVPANFRRTNILDEAFDAVPETLDLIAPGDGETVVADFDADGKLRRVTGQTGAFVSYLYDAQNLLTTVVDESGRTISFSYDAQGRLLGVTDAAGREVVYAYDPAGHLTSVRSPIVTGTPTGNDFSDGKTTTYAYATGTGDAKLDGNLLSITTAAQGAPALQFVYGGAGDALDRVTSVVEGGTNASGVPAGGTSTLDWSFVNAGADPALLDLPRRHVTLTDAAGNRSQLETNARGDVLTLVEETNREVRPGETDYVSHWFYNADGEVVRADWPGGASTLLTYDSSGADPFRHGNLLELRLVADPARGDGSGTGTAADDVVWTFAYEPVHNELYAETGPAGNNPLYVPENGGAWSPERYTTRFAYDYEEGDFAANGIEALAQRWGISLAGATCCHGDTDGDGRVDLARGLPVAVTAPGVALDGASRQAAIEGDGTQDVVTLLSWDDHGQLVRVRDPESNVHRLSYNSETDPDGDGVPVAAPPDGRTLDPSSGGLVRTIVIDSDAGALRNNGTNPAPVAAQFDVSYDALGRVTGVVDPRGVQDKCTWNALDQEIELRVAAATAGTPGPLGDPGTSRGETGVAPLAYRTRFVYDAEDNVTEIHEEDTGAGPGAFLVTRFTYDALGAPVREEVPLQGGGALVTQRRYDANGNPVEVTLPDGSVHQATFDERDLPASLTLGAGGAGGGVPSHTSLIWSPRSNVSLYGSRTGATFNVTFDGHDRPRLVTAGSATSEVRYGLDGRVAQVLVSGSVGGSGGAVSSLGEIHLLRDELGRPIRVDRKLFVPAGVTTLRPPLLQEGALLPGDGFVNTSIEYDRDSRVSFVTDDAGAPARSDYDGRGLRVRLASPDGTGPQSWAWTYDAAGNLAEMESIEYASSAAIVPRTILKTFFVDALGRPVMTVDPSGLTERVQWSSFDEPLAFADANGPPGGTLLRRSKAHSGESVAINAHGNVTRWFYRSPHRNVRRERILTATGQGDGTWSPVPDTSNPSNPDGLITDIATWSSSPPQLALTDDSGAVTTLSFDDSGHVAHRVNPDGTQWSAEHDARGLPTTVTDENGSRIVQTFDEFGRATRLSIARAPGVEGSTVQNIDYDAVGRVTRGTDNNDPNASADDIATFYVYDSLSRPIEERTRRQGVTDVAVSYRWTAADRLTGVVYPDGRTLEYGFDVYGRNVSYTDGAGGSVTLVVAGKSRTLEALSAQGARSTALDDAGHEVVGYDASGRLVQWRHLAPGGGLLAGYEYRYDGKYHVTSVRHQHRPSGAGAFGRVFRYDSAGRLVEDVETTLDANHAIVGPVTYGESFTLDGRGGRTQMTRGGVAFTNTPNNLGQYNEPQGGGTSFDDGAPDDYLDRVGTPPDGWNFAYDRCGNRTVAGPVSVAYDAFGRPVRATSLATGASVGLYGWDVFDRMTRHVDGAGNETRTSFAILLGSGVEERDANNNVTKSSVGPIKWMAPESLVRRVFSAAAPPRDVLGDGLGGTAAVVDAAVPFGVLERVDYDASGKPFFLDAAGVALRDALGRFAASSATGLDRLQRGTLYLPEFGLRTADRATDWGGSHAAGGTCDDPNTVRPLSLNGLPPGEPILR